MGRYSSFFGMVAWGRGSDKVEGAGHHPASATEGSRNFGVPPGQPLKKGPAVTGDPTGA